MDHSPKIHVFLPVLILNCPMFKCDHINSFILKNIKSLSGINMWPSSKKTYVLNRSCMELYRNPSDLYRTPSKRKENPFCFSIPVTYFSFLDSEKGKKFSSSYVLKSISSLINSLGLLLQDVT